jgi:hypothetical protein
MLLGDPARKEDGARLAAELAAELDGKSSIDSAVNG